jgi:hypothetical protein
MPLYFGEAFGKAEGSIAKTFQGLPMRKMPQEFFPTSNGIIGSVYLYKSDSSCASLF